MKDIGIKEIGLHKAYYALDLCLLHRMYVDDKYGFFPLTTVSINILHILSR